MKKVLLCMAVAACSLVAFSQDCNPPRNLSGTTTKNKVILNWEAPAAAGDEEVITWSGDDLASGIGISSNTTEFTALHKFTASDIADYVGWTVTKIDFGAYDGGTFTAKAWKGTGSNPSGAAIFTQSVPNPSLQAWNQVVLNDPFVIESGQTYWFGYSVVAASASGYPAGTDGGPAITGKGDVCGFNGSWTTLSANNLDYNFLIKTTVQNGKGETKELVTKASVSSYNIYRDGTKVGSTEALTYVDEGLEMETTYEYCVEAVYSDGCTSEQICGEFTTQGVTCTPPTNVVATTTLDAINVTWEAPYIPSGEEWITWSGEPDGNSIGTGQASDFYCAQRFAVEDIAPYAGYELTKVKFVPCEANCTYSIRVWTGSTSMTNPGTLVCDQVIDAADLQIGAWTEITLDNPVSISGGEEVWFGYRANTQTGHPAGTDAGPVVEGKGNMMYFQGWTTLSQLGDFNYNWAIQGFVELGGKEMAMNAPIENAEEAAPSKGQIEEKLHRVFKAAPVMKTRDAVTSYNIYINDELAGTVDGNTFEYTEAGFEDGEYNVCVSAVYDNGCESPALCSETEVITTCWPVNNLEYTVLAKKNVKLTWTEPVDPNAPQTWLSWSGEPGGNAIGTGSANDFSVAHRYEPADITDYEGMNIVAVNFYPNEANCEYSLRIWVGGDQSAPGDMVVDQVIAAEDLMIGSVNLVYLDTPVTIDATQELWVGYRCNTQTGHPAGCDDGPRVDYKGNMMFFSGSWITMWEAGGGSQGGLDYNWVIQAGLVDGNGKAYSLSPLADNTSTADFSTDFVAAECEFEGYRGLTLDHYVVYRDGEVIKDNLKATTYTDLNRTTGVYEYSVTAVFTNGCESDPVSVSVEINNDGINDVNSSVNVYPNPTNGYLTIDGVEMTSVTIYNNLGQVVENIVLNGNSVKLNVANYAAGMYFVDVNTVDGEVVRTKVVVSK